MSAREPLQANANRAADGSRDARALLATCVAAAVKGAEAVRSHGQDLETLAWEEKSRADYVTAADRDSEHAIRDVIAARHRDAVILGEELSPEVAAATMKAGLVFVVDPLDGTTNFLHGFPWYAVSIAAMYEGALVASAILNVPNGDLFTAVAGSGARRGGQPIHVSNITEPIRSLFATGFPFKQTDQVEQYLRGLDAVMKEAAGVRRVGAASLDLADVACGRYEAFWELSLAPWDIAAGILLVREAGGVVTDLEGLPAQITHTSIVAGNPKMQAWLLEVIRDRR
ncbi:MAG TPA: inositol monophosphatase family protein [Gemmatimonadaceae bacterium]|jgi:myo-inositol-1(or 4)-monophosphatase